MFTIKITDDDREAEMLNKAKSCYLALYKLSAELRAIRKNDLPFDVEDMETTFYGILDDQGIDLDTLE